MRFFSVFIISLLLLLLYKPSSTQASDPATFLIINQIRGGESCCLSGYTELIEIINQDDQLKNLPIGWALRYDAISDKRYQEIFQKNHNLGILLEITPQLASISGVKYKGKPAGEDWYLAKNALLIGYTQDERKKLLDTLFAEFKNKFDSYPSFTVSWMIDSWSLSYIYKVYGVKLHEITKEQYETDSYTLYGGIFNAPYYPSLNHPLIPGKEGDLLPIVIVRQTISDLSYNYGTQKAIYTSQPNDYLSEDIGGFEYFQKLVSDTISQTSLYRFAVVGFENSYTEQKFINEYIRQLMYLKNLSDEGNIRIVSPGGYVSEHRNKFKNNQAFSFTSSTDKKAVDVFWYFSPYYRARILRRGHKLMLTDLRNYISLIDPYMEKSVDADYAYWIMPYLIDGSQMFGRQSETVVTNDILGNPFGIVLGEGNFEIEVHEDQLSFIDKVSGNTILFTPHFIALDRSNNLYFSSPITKDFTSLLRGNQNVSVDFPRHPQFVAKHIEGEIKLGWNVDGKDVVLFGMREEDARYLLYPYDFVDGIELLSPIFQPDKSRLPFDPKSSIFYWHNREAIAGRNPIRLFVLPRNKYQRPVIIEHLELNVTPKDEVEVVYPSDYSYRVTPWFVDMTAEKPVDALVSVKVDYQETVKSIPIHFYTDCKRQMLTCFKHPRQLFGYAKNIITGWVQKD